MSVYHSILATGLLAAIVAGCSTYGGKFDPQRVSELKPGVSTITEAASLLGPPKAESNFANGSRLLQWQYVHGSILGGSGAHVAVLFDKDGRMVRVTHKYDSQAR